MSGRQPESVIIFVLVPFLLLPAGARAFGHGAAGPTGTERARFPWPRATTVAPLRLARCDQEAARPALGAPPAPGPTTSSVCRHVLAPLIIGSPAGRPVSEGRARTRERPCPAPTSWTRARLAPVSARPPARRLGHRLLAARPGRPPPESGHASGAEKSQQAGRWRRTPRVADLSGAAGSQCGGGPLRALFALKNLSPRGRGHQAPGSWLRARKPHRCRPTIRPNCRGSPAPPGLRPVARQPI